MKCKVCEKDVGVARYCDVCHYYFCPDCEHDFTHNDHVIREQQRFKAAKEFMASMLNNLNIGEGATAEEARAFLIGVKADMAQTSLMLADALLAALDTKREKDEN